MKKQATFTLGYDKKAKTWQLTSDATKKVLNKFARKEEAKRAGVLFDLIGKAGGAVKIKRITGGIVETRHYPSPNNSRYDPRR